MGTEQECYELYWTNPGSNTPQSSSCMATYLPSLKPSKLDEQDMQDIISDGPLHMVGKSTRTYP